MYRLRWYCWAIQSGGRFIELRTICQGCRALPFALARLSCHESHRGKLFLKHSVEMYQILIPASVLAPKLTQWNHKDCTECIYCSFNCYLKQNLIYICVYIQDSKQSNWQAWARSHIEKGEGREKTGRVHQWLAISAQYRCCIIASHSLTFNNAPWIYSSSNLLTMRFNDGITSHNCKRHTVLKQTIHLAGVSAEQTNFNSLL